MGQKTRAEIDDLILAWRDDPTWEIEDTEGFEDHKPELLALRLKCEAEWKARAQLEHANAIAALIKPARAWLGTVNMAPLLGISLHGRADTVGGSMTRPALDMLLTAFAEMLLPIQKQIDRLDSRVDDVDRELDTQVDGLRKQIGARS